MNVDKSDFKSMLNCPAIYILSTIAGTLEFSLITALMTPEGELIFISIRGIPIKGEGVRFVGGFVVWMSIISSMFSCKIMF
jgi:hypothetical protein